MADNEVSLRLLDKFTDFLRNYDSQVEIAEGVFWNRITEAQRLFMVNFFTTKIDYPIFLFKNQSQYRIPEWIMEICEMELRNTSDEPISPHITRIAYPQVVTGVVNVSLPRTTMANDRYMKAWMAADFEDGWRIMTKAFIRPLDSDVINRQTQPMIESVYYDLLVDYCLSFYRMKIIDGKQIVNPNLRSLPEIFNEVQKTRNRMYGLDSVSILHPTGWYGG